MDSKAQLALMAKAQKVFANDQSFLSFPVTPLVYSKDDFDFSMTGSAEEIAQKRRNIEAFSLLVNLIPGSEAWIPGNARFLWDEYSHVLQRGTCASSTRTPEEQARYQAARDFLKDRDEDGFERDSPQLVKYKEYEDAYNVAWNRFVEARIGEAGEFAEDETVRNHWHAVLEPGYQEQLANIRRQWVLDGFKNEVEAMMDELQALGARSPLATWLDWKASFNPDINSQTSAESHLEVFPTSFSPTNALDEDSWNKFELNSTTIEALVAEAPESLKERFGISSNETNIEKMELQFSMALLHRHWFNQDVFHARFWRLDDVSKVLSDGAQPAQGDCPAYVTGIVFARHITVKEKATTQSGSQLPHPPVVRPVGPLKLEFSPLAVGRPLVQQLDPQLLQSIHPSLQQRVNLARTPLRSRGARVSAAATIRRPAVPHATTVRPAGLARPPVRPVTARPVTARPLPANAQLRPILELPQLQELAQLRIQPQIKRLDIAKPVPGIGTLPSPPPPQSDPDEIQILAFICTPVPKCPNPDSTLTW